MEIYYDLFVIYAMSLLTFALYGWDKHLAVYQKTRIPEFILLLFQSFVAHLEHVKRTSVSYNAVSGYR